MIFRGRHRLKGSLFDSGVKTQHAYAAGETGQFGYPPDDDRVLKEQCWDVLFLVPDAAVVDESTIFVVRNVVI